MWEKQKKKKKGILHTNRLPKHTSMNTLPFDRNPPISPSLSFLSLAGFVDLLVDRIQYMSTNSLTLSHQMAKKRKAALD